MSHELSPGLFEVKGTMPCHPWDIKIDRYRLPETLGRIEREEVAARILTFSQQLNRWVGVSMPRLYQMMQEEYEERKRIQTAIRKSRILCILTLGIYALFVSKAPKQLREVPKLYTGIYMFGMGFIFVGINELVERGMLEHFSEGDGDNPLAIFYPTPALISTIMKKQGISIIAG